MNIWCLYNWEGICLCTWAFFIVLFYFFLELTIGLFFGVFSFLWCITNSLLKPNLNSQVWSNSSHHPQFQVKKIFVFQVFSFWSTLVLLLQPGVVSVSLSYTAVFLGLFLYHHFEKCLHFSVLDFRFLLTLVLLTYFLCFGLAQSPVWEGMRGNF